MKQLNFNFITLVLVEVNFEVFFDTHFHYFLMKMGLRSNNIWWTSCKTCSLVPKSTGGDLHVESLRIVSLCIMVIHKRQCVGISDRSGLSFLKTWR